MSAAHVDSDDGDGKMITKKEMKLLTAIHNAEPTILGAVSEEYKKLSGGKELDLEKFVNAFRKFAPYFVQMLTADSSDDSDDDDVTIPSKIYRFINAFTNSRDLIVTAIIKSYKELYKNDLKDLNLSIFRNHYLEIFKGYGRTQCSPHFSTRSDMEGRPSSILMSDKTPVPSLEAISHTEHTMNVNDVSLDMEEGGSLVSGVEEELRKTMESGSSTPTPTTEDWNGIKQSHTLSPQSNKSSNAMDNDSAEKCNEFGFLVGRRWIPSRPKSAPKEMLPHSDPSAVPVTMGDSISNVAKMPLPSNLQTPPHSNISMTDGNNRVVKAENAPLCQLSPSPQCMAARGKNGVPLNVSTPHEFETMSGSTTGSTNELCVSSRGSSRTLTSSNIPSTEVNKEKENGTEVNGLQIAQTSMDDDDEKKENMLAEGLKDKIREVHQDLRFFLPTMIERATRIYEREKRPLTLAQLIGDEYYDERLERFMIKMLNKDKALQEIFQIEMREHGEIVVHFRILMNNEDALDEEMSHPIEEKTVEEASMTWLIPSIDHPSFLFPHNEFPLIFKPGEYDVVNQGDNIGIFSFNMSSQVDAQLQELRDKQIDHLSVSNARHLEKDTALVAMDATNSYCRVVVAEEWNRREDTTPDMGMVRCLLIDYGDIHELPINVLYRFPRWTDTVLPAVVLKCRLDAVPVGAMSDNQMFSMEIWINIEKWIKDGASIHVLRYEGEKYCIDLVKGENESLVHLLHETSIAQKNVSVSSSSPPPPSPPSFPSQSLLPQPSHNLPNSVVSNDEMKDNSGLEKEKLEHEKKERERHETDWNETNIKNELRSTDDQLVTNAMNGMVLVSTPQLPLIVSSDDSPRCSLLDVPATCPSILQLIRPSSPLHIPAVHVPGITTSTLTTRRRLVEIVSDNDA
ncbi:hypothetical protein PFISCL1PPCAC_20035 [Pristionchus fissidentatus]|uniref:Uncharacterized protein n=1 Tax=Pristionchus fissidentatus TaxID=1538716 RepID=A0AAV5WEF5_9BILA|nr:hypothetical protein PFISCL1PPCAC_20035 [Pristionchus fissidentatus]